MATRSLTESTTAMFAILESLSPAERQRVVIATFALLGDEAPSAVVSRGPSQVTPGGSDGGSVRTTNELGLSERTVKWLRQNNIGHEELEEVFHFSGGKVEIIAGDLPGESKRERTAQSYLLEGFRAFLESGEAKFPDDVAMQLTKKFGAFDTNNHAGSRRSLGNNLSGSRQSGFELSQPGLRAAGALVKEIAAATRKDHPSAD